MSSAYDRLLEATRATGNTPTLRRDTVPADYAEKTMSSLLALHADLMDEKESRIDLTRELMNQRQTYAELESYVRLLEVELARLGGPELLGVREASGQKEAGRKVLEGIRAAAPPPPRPSGQYRAPVPVVPRSEEASEPRWVEEPPPPPPRVEPQGDPWRQW